jgi:signal transduction histidine kinase
LPAFRRQDLWRQHLVDQVTDKAPLTIITASTPSTATARFSPLRDEVARINQVVEQLVRVARLYSVALDVWVLVNLQRLADEVVGSMADLALAAGRTISLTGADHPVVVIGNAAAITDALRNLIENALVHTPPETEMVGRHQRPGRRSGRLHRGSAADLRTLLARERRSWRRSRSGSGDCHGNC